MSRFQASFTRFSAEHAQGLQTIQRYDELLSLKAGKHQVDEVYKMLEEEHATKAWVAEAQHQNDKTIA